MGGPGLDDELFEKPVLAAAQSLGDVPGSLLPEAYRALLHIAISAHHQTDERGQKKLKPQDLPVPFQVLWRSTEDSVTQNALTEVLSHTVDYLQQGDTHTRALVNRLAEYAGSFSEPAQRLFFLLLANRWIKHVNEISLKKNLILSMSIMFALFFFIGSQIIRETGPLSTIPLLINTGISLVISIGLAYLAEFMRVEGIEDTLEKQFGLIYQLTERLPLLQLRPERYGVIQIERLSARSV
jgi:hypothetical protein